MKAQLNHFGPFKMLKLSFYKPLYSFVLQPHSTTRNRSMGPWQPAEHGHMQKHQKFVKFKQSRGVKYVTFHINNENTFDHWLFGCDDMDIQNKDIEYC